MRHLFGRERSRSGCFVLWAQLPPQVPPSMGQEARDVPDVQDNLQARVGGLLEVEPKELRPTNLLVPGGC